MTEAQHVVALINYIERARFGSNEDGLHFPPTDAALAVKALRALAGRSRRSQAPRRRK